MLGKVLKYDLRREIKSILPMYIVALLFPILIRLMGLLKDSVSIFSFIYTLVLIVYILSLVALIFMTFFVSIKNFISNLLKDEGYLTHTLPVKKSTFIISKEITALITMAISIIVVVLSLVFTFVDGNNVSIFIDSMGPFIHSAFGMYGMGVVEGYAYWITLFILSYLSTLTTFYLSLLWGHTRNTNRIMFSIIFGIIIYTIIQIISMIGLGIDILIKPEIMDSLTSSAYAVIPKSTIDAFGLVLYSQLIMSIIMTIIIHFLSCYTLQKKLNLE